MADPRWMEARYRRQYAVQSISPDVLEDEDDERLFQGLVPVAFLVED